tara:strand:- start:3092 stop:3523 length:432 start_codon:yes stop_codon:yes gene_type:complete
LSGGGPPSAKDAQAIASDAALRALGAVQLKQMLRSPPGDKKADTSAGLIGGNLGPLDQAMMVAALQQQSAPPPSRLGGVPPGPPQGPQGLPLGPGIPMGPPPAGIPQGLGIGAANPLQMAGAIGPPPNPIDLILSSLAKNQGQ